MRAGIAMLPQVLPMSSERASPGCALSKAAIMQVDKMYCAPAKLRWPFRQASRLVQPCASCSTFPAFRMTCDCCGAGQIPFLATTPADGNRTSFAQRATGPAHLLCSQKQPAALALQSHQWLPELQVAWQLARRCTAFRSGLWQPAADSEAAVTVTLLTRWNHAWLLRADHGHQ